MDQAEFATDVMFKDRQTLVDSYSSLVAYSMKHFSAVDVLRFLGRKPHGNLKGEVTTDLKGRPEGQRVKHRLERNSLEMYDKSSVSEGGNDDK